jgi:hypothetical protein
MFRWIRRATPAPRQTHSPSRRLRRDHMDARLRRDLGLPPEAPGARWDPPSFWML